MDDCKFYGNYRGLVIDVNDPLSSGRVKVRVYGVYDDIPTAVIPWAQYADPFMGGLQNIGGIIVPDLGADVWVFFEGGDHHNPVYFAGAPSAGDVPSAHTPSNKVLRTKSGFTVEIDDNGGATIRISHPTGSNSLFDAGGNKTETITGGLTIAVNGPIDISSSSSIKMTAPRIDLN